MSDKLITPYEVRLELGFRIAKGSRQSVAQELGISEAYLSQIMTGARAISPAIAKKLGWEEVVMYRAVQPEVT